MKFSFCKCGEVLEYIKILDDSTVAFSNGMKMKQLLRCPKCEKEYYCNITIEYVEAENNGTVSL